MVIAGEASGDLLARSLSSAAGGNSPRLTAFPREMSNPLPRASSRALFGAVAAPHGGGPGGGPCFRHD